MYGPLRKWHPEYERTVLQQGSSYGQTFVRQDPDGPISLDRTDPR